MFAGDLVPTRGESYAGAVRNRSDRGPGEDEPYPKRPVRVGPSLPRHRYSFQTSRWKGRILLCSSDERIPSSDWWLESETHGWCCCEQPQASRRPHNRTNGVRGTSSSDAGPCFTTPSFRFRPSAVARKTHGVHIGARGTEARPTTVPSASRASFTTVFTTVLGARFRIVAFATTPARRLAISNVFHVDRAARAALSQDAWERFRARGKVLGCAGGPWRTHGPCMRPGGLATAPVGSEARKVRAIATRRRRP